MRQLQLRWVLVAVTVVGAAALGGSAGAAMPDATVSLGYPNAGRLVGGRRFRETPYMAVDEAHATSPVRWALPALLSVLDRASRIVARKFPGSVLEIGELSRRDGGRISSHLSHQNGRDADVGFYQTSLDGESVHASRFVRFDGAGESRDDPTVRFDEKRNWAFVRAVLEDSRYEVRQIFIYAPLRARLLAYAAKVGAPRDLRNRAARAMMQPGNALPHDDHFHIRISCPPDQIDLGCADLPLWRPPDSADEFGPDLLAEAPRTPAPPTETVVSPYDWGRISKLWSVEQGVCHKAEMICNEVDEGPLCEDAGDSGLPVASLPIDGVTARTAAATAPIVQATPPIVVADSDPPALATLEEGAEPGPTSVTNEETIYAAAFSSMVGGPASDDAKATYCAADPGDATGRDVPEPGPSYCALDDEPNACERSVTALVSAPDATSHGNRSVIE